MKFRLTIILFLITTLAKGQSKTVIIFAENDKKPLSNVFVYHKANIIGESDKEGKVKLQLKGLDSLAFVKNGYEDIFISCDELKEHMWIRKIEGILLSEVNVSPLSPQILLKRVMDFAYGIDGKLISHAKSNYSEGSSLQVYNLFKANDDTLHYLNNRMVYKRFKGFEINDQIKIIKNFYLFKDKLNLMNMYKLKGKETNFYEMFNVIPTGLWLSSFQDVCRYSNNFDLKLIEDSNYYRLEFRQKKKFWFEKPQMEGFMIVDKDDYGVYEFESKLLNKKPHFVKATNFSNKTAIVFKIFEDNYQCRYVKDNETYVLKSCSRDTKFIEVKGSHKNISFNNVINVERTFGFIDKNLRKFDVFTWNIN